MPKLSLPSLRLGRRPKLTPISIAITVLALLLLLAASAAAAYWYLPKATVSIFVKPTTKTQSLSFIASLDASSVSLEDNTVPAQNPQTEVTGTNQITATGEKLVGELASGTVTIFNRTNSAKTFEAGTKLTGPDSLVYTINEDVTVASASTKENADLSLVSQPSTVDVGVSAGNIGANHNLGSGTEFSVSNFDRSSYLARAKTDIAGGTSREITAVSQDDVDTLRQELITKLEEKAKAQITSGPSDLLAVAILNQAKPQIEETYSADVGDEAESVSLDAILTISTLTYKKSDIAKLIEGSIDLPEGKSLSANEIDIESISIEELEEGSYQIESRVNINIKPQLDTEDIARKLRGKYPAITESYFKSLPNFARVEIDITPDLPTKLKTFPRIVDNITVDVKLTE